MKSANILLDEYNHAYLTDFGLSAIKSEKISKINKCTEDFAWVAPEILSGGEGVRPDSCSDIYSFGVVLWEIMTGKVPYEGCDKDEILAQISEGKAIHNAIPSSVPAVYRDLIRDCCKEDDFMRPNISKIIDRLEAYTPSTSPTSAGENQARFWSSPSSSSSSSSSSSDLPPIHQEQVDVRDTNTNPLLMSLD